MFLILHMFRIIPRSHLGLKFPFGHIFLDRYAPEEQPVCRSRVQVEESGSGGATCYVELMSLKMKSL